MKEHYVYIYLDPRKPGQYTYPELNISFLYEPFYVGKGKGYRYIAHLSKSSLTYNTHKNNKIKAIKNKNLKPFIIKYKNYITNKKASEIEKVLIEKIGRYDLKLGPLTNKTDGGEGMLGHISPKKGLSIEQIYGIEKALELRSKYGSPGITHPLFGKGHSEETKQKIKDNHHNCSGSNNPRAKFWKLISPDNKEFIVKGTLKKFCKEYNLSYSILMRNKNNGKIPKSKSNKQTELTINTENWECQSI